MSTQDQIDAMLKVDEGTGPMKGGRFVVYDDATGQPIVPGSVVKGHPTIAYGLALDVRGLSMAEALWLLHTEEMDFQSQLTAALPWTTNLDSVRQAALLSMVYNLGVQGLLGFPKFLAAMQAHNWTTAVAELKNSKWWGQVGSRAVRISNMILSGQWQVKV